MVANIERPLFSKSLDPPLESNIFQHLAGRETIYLLHFALILTSEIKSYPTIVAVAHQTFENI